MKILLVDDDATLLSVTEFALRRAGFLVITAPDGEQALRQWEVEVPDLILLDIQLPERDGLSVLRQIRDTSNVPVILLTVRSSDEDIVLGLELGADDYVVKPFSPKQLIARCRAVLRRSTSVASQSLTIGAFVLDPDRHTVQHGAEIVRLTRLEFRLLHYLLINTGNVIPTEALLTHVWGYSESGDRAMLKQLVYRVRQKLTVLGRSDTLLATVAGVGYLMERNGPDARN
jgi:DNA-binding response OmpR family regulator